MYANCKRQKLYISGAPYATGFCDTLQRCGAVCMQTLSSRMAYKEKQTLTCFLIIWLGSIEVCSFVAFKEDKSVNSRVPLNEYAQRRESYGEKQKTEAQVGRLLISQDQTSRYDGEYRTSGLGTLTQPHNDESSYQSDDAGWINLKPLWGRVYGLNAPYTPAVERLLGMKPKVDCVGDLMKLTVHGGEATFGSNFLIDRGSIPPLPLSQLPSECGHTLLRTWRDFIFIIPYDGCYVSHERDMHVLPLLWWGLPIKMSCSTLTLARSTPTVSCYPNGMIVKLQKGVFENLKIKVMNEWQPLLIASSKCGYSLVSHQEGLVIHAPYMPCTEAKDGMFTLNMAAQTEFNLSCPVLILGLPVNVSDPMSKNDTSPAPVSSMLAPPSATVETTRQITIPAKSSPSSDIQESPPTPLPYRIPGQPHFKPVPPNLPVLFFHPSVPPTVVPHGPKAVETPSAVTQRPQASASPKPYDPQPPKVWYPWHFKPNLAYTTQPMQPTQSSALPPYPRKPLLPTKAPKPPLGPLLYLLKPTNIPFQDKITSTTPMTPNVQWAPVYPPSNLAYPLHPGKPGFVGPSSAFFPQFPWPSQTHARPDVPPRLKPSESQAAPKPVSTPPIPDPTRKPETVQFFHYPWYKPFPSHHLELPSIPTKVPQISTVSTPETAPSSPKIPLEKPKQVAKPQPSMLPYHSIVQGPPMSLHFDFTPGTAPTPAPSKQTETKAAHTSAPMKAPFSAFSSSHALFHCPTYCPGPPSISYHHHNHHHFGHPFHVSNLGTSSLTKIRAQMPLSPITSGSSTSAPLPFIQGIGYHYGSYFQSNSSIDAALPPVSGPAAMQYLASSDSSLMKSTSAPDTSELMANPTMCPHIFRTLTTTASPQSAMKPADVAPVVQPLDPSKLLSRPLQNAPIAEPLVNLVQSPKPAVYWPEMQHYVSPWVQQIQRMVVSHNVGNVGSLSQEGEHQASLAATSKPTIPPDHGKKLSLNYWYPASNSYVRPTMSSTQEKIAFNRAAMPQLSSPQALTNDHNPPEYSSMPLQPRRIPDLKSPVQLNPSLQIRNSVPMNVVSHYESKSGEPPVPVFRTPESFDSYWISAVQSNQEATLRSS